MKTNPIFTICTALFLLASCSEKKKNTTSTPARVKQQIQQLSESLAESEKKDDLKAFLAYYDENAISMPEYQPTLQGINEIEAFYKEIFQRQDIKTFQRTSDEIIDLDSTIIDIGTFKKEYTGSNADSLLTQNGKYCHVWKVQPDGRFLLKGEAFGFFHPIDKPEALTVQLFNTPLGKSAVYLNQEIPLELQAYNALMEKGVRIRDGALRSTFFTDDGKFMPFQEPTLSGMAEIKPYLIEYSSRGNVTIDSIAVYTYHYEYLDDYVLEYPEFRVKWSVPQFSGRTEGKGIRLWKRQEDKSLKLFREIGTHNHL